MAKERRGFIPTAAQRAELLRADCAYLHSDGVTGFRRLRIPLKVGGKATGETVHREQWFKWPATIGLHIASGRDRMDRINRVVIHDPRMIADGVEHFEVYFNNGSEASRAKSLSVDTLTLYTPNGGCHSSHDLPGIIGSGVTVQGQADHVPASITDYPDNGTICE